MDKILKIAHDAQKEKMQDMMEWSDDQFDIYWRNPRKNGFAKGTYLLEVATVLKFASVITQQEWDDFSATLPENGYE